MFFGNNQHRWAAYYNPMDYRVWKNLFEIRKMLYDYAGADEAYENMLKAAPPEQRASLAKIKRRKSLFEDRK